MTLLSATALATSPAPTISMTNDWRAGLSMPLATPMTVARSMIIQTWMFPVSVSTASVAAWTVITDWVAMSSLRLSARSAIRPPQGPITRTGPNWSATTMLRVRALLGAR